MPRGIDWVIVGGESGPGARPCDVKWIRGIVKQCKATSVPCFVKQLGAYVTTDLDGEDDGFPEGTIAIPDRVIERGGDDCTLRGRVSLKSSKGGDISEFPVDLRVREFPKVAVPS